MLLFMEELSMDSYSCRHKAYFCPMVPSIHIDTHTCILQNNFVLYAGANAFVFFLKSADHRNSNHAKVVNTPRACHALGRKFIES